MENKGCRLICVGSSSLGNSYAIDSGSELLLLEAGMKMADVKKSIDYRINNVVGCLTSHRHFDHSKYAVEYSRFGIKVYCNEDTASNKSFAYGTYKIIEACKTYHIGSFSVTPFEVAHDVPCFGFLIKHPSSGVILFATDTYKIPLYVSGIDHYLIEANYCDDILRENVWSGKVDNKQADRIMLAHMSLDYTVKYLMDCKAENAKTITLCHLSERNSNPDSFQRTVAGAFGVPTYIAKKGLVVELNKNVI